MARRWKRLSHDEQQQLGDVILDARNRGIAWKVLEQVYGRSRENLWRYTLTANCNKKDENCNITAVATPDSAVLV